jgi:hypothetical protein
MSGSWIGNSTTAIPPAKGKGNVDCTDASNPLRSHADVCGASWSQTLRDP